jgi:flavorubredoxin
MKVQVTEVGPDLYRISIFHPGYGIQINQYLLDDDEPFLMHTNFQKVFPASREAVASVMDPAKLRWIGFSHFEPDECGALNNWLEVAPKAQAAVSVVGTIVMMEDYAIRPARGLADGEVFETGRHRLRFLATPHVPHGWDAGLYFDEKDRTLFCSDLFFQGGECTHWTESDVVGPAREAIVQGMASPLAKDMPYTPYTDATLTRLAALKPQTLAVMHGSTFHGDGERALIELASVIKDTHGRAT